MSNKAILRVVGLVLVAGALVGCKTRDPWSVYENPAGVQGGDSDYLGDGYGSGDDYVGAELPAERLTGGEEHSDMFAAVHFGYNSNAINSTEAKKLEDVATYLSDEKDVAMIVEGHCDERGSREYNLALGERRALAVREYLIGLGVAADRIQTRTMGEEQAAVDGHDESAWSQNRRAEFVVYY